MNPKVPEPSKAMDLTKVGSSPEMEAAQPSAPYAGQHKDPNAMYASLKRKLGVPNRSGTKATF